MHWFPLSPYSGKPCRGQRNPLSMSLTCAVREWGGGGEWGGRGLTETLQRCTDRRTVHTPFDKAKVQTPNATATRVKPGRMRPLPWGSEGPGGRHPEGREDSSPIPAPQRNGGEDQREAGREGPSRAGTSKESGAGRGSWAGAEGGGGEVGGGGWGSGFSLSSNTYLFSSFPCLNS